MSTKFAYICGSARTPFVKSFTAYNDISTQVLMTATLQKLIDKLHLAGRTLGDVALGAVMLSSYDWDLARECVLGTTLDPHTPGYNLQRACGTSLEAISQIALKIAYGQIDCGIGAGVDSNSDMPLMFQKTFAKKMIALRFAKTLSEKLKIIASFRPSDLKPQLPAIVEPRTGLSMGEHCEKMVKEWQISQKEQDQLALASHLNSAKAYDEGFYQDLIFEFNDVKRDGSVRKDTSLEKLSTLKPAFDLSGQGTLTAGNSSPLSDGSAAVFLASAEYAKQHQHDLLARFVDAEVAAVDFVHGDGLLMAPTIAVNKLLQRHQLTLQDFDFYEIHEAFAGQVLCTLKAWESAEYCKKVLGLSQPLGSIERSKLNAKGSSVALGHPYAATGARIVGQLAKMLHAKGQGRGLISICTAGGMGVAAILEGVK